MASALTQMKQLIGLLETALNNANRAEAKGSENEQAIAETEENLAVTELTMIENYEAQEEINSQTENALIEIYEMMEV